GTGAPGVAGLQHAVAGVDVTAHAVHEHDGGIGLPRTRRAPHLDAATHSAAAQHQVEIAAGAAGQCHVHAGFAGERKRHTERGECVRATVVEFHRETVAGQ